MEVPVWKRIFDVTCVVISLPCWLIVMICVALWVRVVSPGPIFFRQERIGFRGRRFTMLKFRTMKVNVETQSHERHLDHLIQANCPMTKLDAGDPRIVRGGRILRALGLDELPQIFNVLRGEMSLVGPRPCTPNEIERYQAWQKERFDAPPGLTGYWQVNGKNRTTFSEMIELDIYYARNMSLRLDLMIILKTFPAILAQLLEARRRASVRPHNTLSGLPTEPADGRRGGPQNTQMRTDTGLQIGLSVGGPMDLTIQTVLPSESSAVGSGHSGHMAAQKGSRQQGFVPKQARDSAAFISRRSADLSTRRRI
jgi:lipopolysaccharide/colanic/teichoic acid biosynthesis glycosyltransferase